MTGKVLDLDALGVEELSSEAAANVNGGGWLSFLGGLLVNVVWDTIKEIYNTWDDFVESVRQGYTAYEDDAA